MRATGSWNLRPTAIQRKLTAFYALEAAADVDAFVRVSDATGRERLLVRDADDGVELALELPAAVLDEDRDLDLDGLCQLVEGVSHFVLVAERARRELPTTQLELELQAEIDKFVVLALAGDEPLAHPERKALHRRLYGGRFVHAAGTELGDRYRTAHALAMRFTHALEQRYLRRGRLAELQQVLRDFYRAGPTSKIQRASAL